METEIFHFLFGCIARKTAGNMLGEVLLGIRQKIDRAFPMPQYAFRGIRGVATFKHHRIIVLSRNVIGEDKRIRSEACEGLIFV